jgi:lipid A ethanolaminephosphotransferase
VTPANLLDSTYGYVAEALKSPLTITPVGEDATRGDHLKAVQRPVVTVLVVGETARADHFSLNGYERETNPELAAWHVVYFEDVSSCGTATAVSLPCMFSDLTRSDYSKSGAKSRDGLLKVVSRAGFQTEWLDNNAGCKGVCDNVDTWISEGMDTEGMCIDGECYDDILLDKLDESLARATRGPHQDRLIVLHQNGSHGPAYYRRYPEAFRRFTPDCRSDEFSDCSREEIVNSYDNTIYYTDHFLARIIDKLDDYSDRMDTALLYVSDHGESLGEYGLYLHGTPYMLAPSSQTHVPMLFWMSTNYRQDFGVDPQCLESRRATRLSHDYLFHSVLGMLDIATAARDSQLDLFDGCAGPAADTAPMADAADPAGMTRSAAISPNGAAGSLGKLPLAAGAVRGKSH